MPEHDTPALVPAPQMNSGPPLPVVSTEEHAAPSVVPLAGSDAPGTTPKGVEIRATPTPAVAPCGCCETGTAGRNLVICIDGTSNQFGLKNTNVVELYSRLEKSDRQLTFYNSGIGTYAEPSWKSWNYYMQVIANQLDLAFALRFEKIIISAYAWLVDNYQEGDRIFLFGFSRGAYQVRALSAMIETVGLLHKGNNDQIPFAYELYAASGKEEWSSMPIVDRISNLRGVEWILAHAEPVRKLFLGFCGELLRLVGKAFEGQLPGLFARYRSRLVRLFDESPDAKMRLIPRQRRPTGTTHQDLHIYSGDLQERFLDTFSRRAVVHFVGAWDTVSSVGVVRDKTLPMTTEGMRHVCFFRHALALHEYRVKFQPEFARGGKGPSWCDAYGKNAHTKEVWFAGSHSDIGGGSSINTTLDKFGPALRWMSLEATTAGLRLMNERMKWEAVRESPSMTPGWRLLECLPIKRLLYEDEDSVTRWPHLCRGRSVMPLQGIHQTVYEDYVVASPPPNVYMEIDEWTTAGRFLILNPEDYWKDSELLHESDVQALRLLLESDTGYQSLLDREIYSHIDGLALACWHRRPASYNAHRALCGLTLLRDSIFNRAYRSEQLETQLLSAVLRTSVSDGPEPFPFGLRGPRGRVHSVRFASPSLVASEAQDGTLHLWDSDSGTFCVPASDHTEEIIGLAVYPGRSLMASASLDRTGRAWKLEVAGIASRYAFSPDEAEVVANPTPAGAVKLHNFEGVIWEVVFSDDNTRIVSRSRCVRLWDAQTMLAVGHPLPGYTGFVSSVAFSPGGTSVAAACGDNTVRIWDATTSQLTHALIGHTGDVLTVAFSPRGKHCASGGDDNLVYIWDAVEGRAVGILKGHTGAINSVAWSPDGSRIVSGSDDETVRVWDRIPVSDLF